MRPDSRRVLPTPPVNLPLDPGSIRGTLWSLYLAPRISTPQCLTSRAQRFLRITMPICLAAEAIEDQLPLIECILTKMAQSNLLLEHLNDRDEQGIDTSEIYLTMSGTATAFLLRLCLHYKAARACGVIVSECWCRERF